MVAIIKYATGIPKGEDFYPRSITGAIDKYKLGREVVLVREYRGPYGLNYRDFEVLRNVLSCKTYSNLKNKKDILKHVENGRFNLRGTSKDFLPALEYALGNIEDPGYWSASKRLLDQSKRKGLFVPVSFAYPTKYYTTSTYLTSDGRVESRKRSGPYKELRVMPHKTVLVYIDDVLRGHVDLENTKAYTSQDGGYGCWATTVITLDNKQRKRESDRLDCSDCLDHWVDVNIRSMIEDKKERAKFPVFSKVITFFQRG